MMRKPRPFNKHGPRNSKAPRLKQKKKRDLEKSEITVLESSKAELDGMNPEEIQSFNVLPLSKMTLKGLREAGFSVPTKVQRQSLVYSLRGVDVVAAAKTGSGKTLAFIVPLDGLGVLVITPTRELAYQIFEVLNKVGKEHDFSAGLVIGGKDLKYEWSRISSCNIMICTPGRLLQHMTENAEFVTDHVQELPAERQTLLFSATQTRDVKDLIRAGCSEPVFCSVHEHSKTSTPKGLQESYVLCSPEEKFTFLWSFIRHHRKRKILVFLATCKQVLILVFVATCKQVLILVFVATCKQVLILVFVATCKQVLILVFVATCKQVLILVFVATCKQVLILVFVATCKQVLILVFVATCKQVLILVFLATCKQVLILVFVATCKQVLILVFVATCKQVQYYYNMFCKLHPGLSVMGLHGSMHQLRRMAVYDEFCRKKNAVLIATDVAARGLDIPAVDWVVQVDCPEDVTTYIHRVGRTARYSCSGEAILLLTPSEEPAMLDCMKAKNIPIEKIDVDSSKLQGANVKMEIVLSKYNNLKEEAVRAFKSYLKHVALMRNKKVFSVTAIDCDAFARSLGLVVTPRVRFIEKQLKQKGQGNTATPGATTTQHNPSVSLKPKLTTLDFGGAGDSDEEEEDFLSTAKDQTIYLPPEDPQDPEAAEEPNVTQSKKKKPITKYAVVKKLLKKNLQINTRVVFDEEGEEILDPRKQQISQAARTEGEEEAGGINIARLQKIMSEEDKVDKKVHAYKQKEKNCLKRRTRELAREAKRARVAQSSTLESLPVDEQEQLALFLLRNKN
ncbi:putative ATP-dependent RNA helicase DDX10 [Chionoecetes opilio]|uniref:ATP-dependent RNA helicase n=1 Tax=Chionoecetes opilio TaxID=41210 RepID=A0A8J4YE85_CHIOP|nr:putative ATP-dependent RNA helicase DDX10 [Chionoecetes opilio]